MIIKVAPCIVSDRAAATRRRFSLQGCAEIVWPACFGERCHPASSTPDRAGQARKKRNFLPRMVVRQEGRPCVCSSPSLSVFLWQAVSPVCQWIRFLEWTTASMLVVATSRASGRSHPLWAHTDPGINWRHAAGCCPLLVPLARRRTVNRPDSLKDATPTFSGALQILPLSTSQTATHHSSPLTGPATASVPAEARRRSRVSCS